jgi:antitoxin HicB
MYTAYPAKLTLDTNETYFVSFPDVPEAKTFAEDKASVNRLAAEALAAALSFYVEAGRPLPVPTTPKRGQILIHLPAATVAKLALYEAMREQGVTQSELARRLGCHRQHAARIVDPAHNTKFEVLEAALAAVGKRAAIMIEDAA